MDDNDVEAQIMPDSQIEAEEEIRKDNATFLQTIASVQEPVAAAASLPIFQESDLAPTDFNYLQAYGLPVGTSQAKIKVAAGQDISEFKASLVDDPIPIITSELEKTLMFDSRTETQIVEHHWTAQAFRQWKMNGHVGMRPASIQDQCDRMELRNPNRIQMLNCIQMLKTYTSFQQMRKLI